MQATESYHMNKDPKRDRSPSFWKEETRLSYAHGFFSTNLVRPRYFRNKRTLSVAAGRQSAKPGSVRIDVDGDRPPAVLYIAAYTKRKETLLGVRLP